MWPYIVAAGVVVVALTPLIFRRISQSRFSPPDIETGTIKVVPNDLTELQGKFILVVGGTRGIGLGTAMALARLGAHVTIVGRSPQSGEKAVKEIQEHVANTTKKQVGVKFISGDLSIVKGALNVVEKIKQEGVKYDHLVVTIGVFPDWKNPMTSDGIEKTIGTMIIGRFVIWQNCLEFLNPDARILNVLSSGRHPSISEIKKELIEKPPTKLMATLDLVGSLNEVMNLNLERKWENSKVQLIGTFPGWSTTELHQGQGFLFDNILFPLLDRFAAVPLLDVGLQNAQYLVSSKITKKLTFLDNNGQAHQKSVKLIELHKKSGEWLWNYLEGFVENHNI